MKDSQINVPVRVASHDYRRVSKKLWNPFDINALVDTGANISCITPTLIKKLMLASVDTGTVTTSDGVSEKKIYGIDMQISAPSDPEKPMAGRKYKELHGIMVMETYGEADRIILGMDIIMRGELNIKGDRFLLRL